MTRMILFASLALVSFGQQQPAPSQGTFVPPKDWRSNGSSSISPVEGLQLLLPAGERFKLQAGPTRRDEAAAAISPRCAVPLLEMKPPSSSDANAIKPRPTGDPMETGPPAPACPSAAR